MSNTKSNPDSSNNHNKRIKIPHAIIYLIVVIISIVPIFPEQAKAQENVYEPTPEDACILTLDQPEWQQRFPFDLVYPVGDEYTPPNECPKITFWDKEWTICSIKTITQIVKNIALVNFGIKTLYDT